jgi:hypothetical protein
LAIDAVESLQDLAERLNGWVGRGVHGGEWLGFGEHVAEGCASTRRAAAATSRTA